MAAAWDQTVSAHPDATILRYFDWECAAGDADELADALAANLQQRGIVKGDRIALFLQNVPFMTVAVLACWKLGAIATLINPMYKSRELRGLLEDSGARVIIGHYYNLHPVREVLDDLGLQHVIAVSSLSLQTANDERVLPIAEDAPDDAFESMTAVLAAYQGRAPVSATLAADDIATIIYTSGTTGPPKGAMSTHRNLVAGALMFQRRKEITAEDVIYAIAPMSHTTGLVGHLCLSAISGAQLVLSYRFHPMVAAEQICASRATYTIGAITAHISLLNNPDVSAEHLASLTKIYTGGAPVPPEVLRRFQEKFGLYIRNGYGMTETSPTCLVPLDCLAPVDAERGAVAVGRPLYDTEVEVWDTADNPVPIGHEGELVVRGPQVIPGYWHRDEESASLLRKGWLHTGDLGFQDADGFVYVVDRLKDVIIASGYKVWPREVEDVLYQHPAVREAAVVGIPDAYRGETVGAYVSIRLNAEVAAGELSEFCAARMAAYKYPREVIILDDLPKSENGKILRRELRLKAGL